jgi:hypothetical protein
LSKLAASAPSEAGCGVWMVCSLMPYVVAVIADGKSTVIRRFEDGRGVPVAP